MVSLFARLVIVYAVAISIVAVASALLMQKFGTILVVVPIIIISIISMAAQIAYWFRKRGIKG